MGVRIYGHPDRAQDIGLSTDPVHFDGKLAVLAKVTSEHVAKIAVERLEVICLLQVRKGSYRA